MARTFRSLSTIACKYMRAVISQANENQETGEMKIEKRTDLSSLG